MSPPKGRGPNAVQPPPQDPKRPDSDGRGAKNRGTRRQDAAGQDTPGQGAKGQDTTGKPSKGKTPTGQELAGKGPRRGDMKEQEPGGQGPQNEDTKGQGGQEGKPDEGSNALGSRSSQRTGAEKEGKKSPPRKAPQVKKDTQPISSRPQDPQREAPGRKIRGAEKEPIKRKNPLRRPQAGVPGAEAEGVQARGEGGPVGPSQPSRPNRPLPSSPETSPLLPVASSPSGVWELGPPDARVAEKAQAWATQIMPARDSPLPSRPEPQGGTIGREFRLAVNHFRVTVNASELDVHQYDVKISPECKSRGVRHDIIALLVHEYRQTHLRGRLPAFDGYQTIYTAGPLPFDQQQFEIILPQEGNGEQAKGESGQSQKNQQSAFKVTIGLPKRLDLSPLVGFLSNTSPSLPPVMLQLLGTVLRERPPYLQYVDLGRATFWEDTPLGSKVTLGDGAECWRGVFQSVKANQSGLTLNANTTTSAFLEPLMVHEFVKELLRSTDAIFSKPLSEEHHSQVERALKSKRVAATHQEKIIRRYTVEGLTTEPMKRLTFPTATPDGVPTGQLGVMEYFASRYPKVKLRYPNMPCIISGGGKRLLPLEVCRIVKGQPYRQRLNDVQASKMLRAAKQDPSQKWRGIANACEFLFSSATQPLAEAFPLTVDAASQQQGQLAHEFGVSLEPRMLHTRARLLPPPELVYGGESILKPMNTGSWGLRGKKFYLGATVRRWAAVDFGSLSERSLVGFCNKIVAACTEAGMAMTPEPAAWERGSPQEYEKVLRRVAASLTPKGGSVPKADIVLCFLTGRTLYGPLKRLCETELGLVTQCCLVETLKREPPLYFTNLAQKINAKAGGTNTFLGPCGVLHLKDWGPTLVVGADVTHPVPGDTGSPSIAAVVGCMDWPQLSQYQAVVEAQEPRKEIISRLHALIKQLLVAFYRHPSNFTRAKPQRIVFYRDGVGEGQLPAVRAEEVMQIKQGCFELEEGYNPALTFVVVQKRHHTRFFAPSGGASSTFWDKNGNAKPGTVVDSTICHRSEFDFFLMSHASIQGTGKPTHYQVVYDENRFTSNALQQFTYNMTHTVSMETFHALGCSYSRCTRSVSIVPPAYYAHLVAYRARYYIDSTGLDKMAAWYRSKDAPGESGAGAEALFETIIPHLQEAVVQKMFFS